MSSFLYEAFIKNIKNNPQKKIIHSLSENLSGKECLDRIAKTTNYLKENKIKQICNILNKISFT